jgi:hypothetical protein
MNPLSLPKTIKLLFVKIIPTSSLPLFLLKIGSVFSQTDQQQKIWKNQGNLSCPEQRVETKNKILLLCTFFLFNSIYLLKEACKNIF